MIDFSFNYCSDQYIEGTDTNSGCLLVVTRLLPEFLRLHGIIHNQVLISCDNYIAE